MLEQIYGINYRKWELDNMAYNEIRNGMKGTPMSLEQRATANKMNMLNKRPSPLEQAMMPKGNFEPIAPPKGIFEPPVKPRMDMIDEIRKKQMPDIESSYLAPKPMQGELAPRPKQPMEVPSQGDILTPPKSSPITPPANVSVGIPQVPAEIIPPNTPPQGDILTAPKGNVVTPPTPPAVLPPPPKEAVSETVAQPIIEPDIINVPSPDIPKENVVPPPIGGVTPPIIPPKGGGLPPPPMGGGGLPSQPEVQPPKGGGTSPTVPSVPAAQPSVPAEQPWQDNTVGAGTSSFQNPYSIQGNMLNPLQYLRGQGVDIGDEYGKYFSQYDTAAEQGAIQQYGLGQDASLASARSNLMQMTQQGLGSGFGGVGFGGAAASGMRSQFGLGAQQAGLSLRGDIHGMRRQQEEDWWDTLAGVEQRRGEMFGENPTTANQQSSSQTFGGSNNPLSSNVTTQGFEQSSGAAIQGAPTNPYEGEAWTNNNGVPMKWDGNGMRWMPAEQYDYYQTRDTGAGHYGL